MSMKSRFLLPLAALAILSLAGCTKSDPDADKAAITDSVHRLAAAVDAKDINGIMAYYVPDSSLFVYDFIPPRQYVGADVYRKDWQGFLAVYSGPTHTSVDDWTVDTDHDLAYAHGTVHIKGTDKDGKSFDQTLRVTDVYKKFDGKWLVVHEHVSEPVDPVTNQADPNSKL